MWGGGVCVPGKALQGPAWFRNGKYAQGTSAANRSPLVVLRKSTCVTELQTQLWIFREIPCLFWQIHY